MTKIASSPTLGGLTELLNKFFYSTSYKISDDFVVTNSNGVISTVTVIKKSGRYIAYAKF